MAISKIESAALASGVPSRSQLPAGTVLQVVYETSTTIQTVTTTTTILTASITPTSASSKVFAIATTLLSHAPSSNSYGIADLNRGGTNIDSKYAGVASGINSCMVYTLQGVDSPATTSPVTYSLAISKASGGTASVSTDGYRYAITLMEIAA